MERTVLGVPAELIARARAAYGADGRLPLESVTWDVFPFEGALRVKQLDDPVLPEPPRQGADAAECSACRRADDTYLWTDARWRLYAPEPAGVPALLLEPRRAGISTSVASTTHTPSSWVC